MTAQRRLQAVVGLAIALIIPTSVPHVHLLGRLGFTAFSGEYFWWGLFAVVILYVLKIERRPLSSIGWRALTPQAFQSAVLIFVAVIAGNLFAEEVLQYFGASAPGPGLSGVAPIPVWFLLLSVVRAAVVEETLFRGYGIERLLELTGSKWVAGVVTVLCFALGHLVYGNWMRFCSALFAGLAFTLLYFWRRNLFANMLAHGFVNLVPTLLLISNRT